MILSAFLSRGAAALAASARCASCGTAAPRGPLVLAPASMQESLTAVAEAWARQGHAAPVLSFAGTQALARQVEAGAPADIIIAADLEWMDWLEDRRLIAPQTRRVVAANGLALVSPRPFAPDDTIATRLRTLADGRLALADPDAVPAGRYARAALKTMGLWDEVKDRVVPGENVRAALALVEAGEAELGVVYKTDARASRRVHAINFDFRDVPEILYPAAMIADASHPEADAFLGFLSAPQAQDIFAAHGFVPMEQAP